MINQSDVQKFSAFISENYPPSHNWEDIEGYCRWYIGMGYIITLVKDEKLVALCAIRPVERPGMGCLPFYANEQGSCLHIDLFINKTDSKTASQLLAYAFRARFGQREWVSLFRRHEEKLHVYSYQKFCKSLGKFGAFKRETQESYHGPKPTAKCA